MSDTSRFVFTLPQKRLRSYNIVSDLLLQFALLVFIANIIQHPTLPVIAGYSLLIVCMVAYRLYIRKRAGKNPVYFVAPVFFMAALGWTLPPLTSIFMALLYAVAGLLEKRAKTPEQIAVTSDGIYVSGYPTKKTEWAVLQNVVLKDNLLTLDYANNKLFQMEVVSEVDEAEFNAFCAERLKGNNQK